METALPLNGESLIAHLRSLSNPAGLASARRFGVQGREVLGVSIPTLRALARKTGKNHRLADELWKSGLHEARILAAYVEEVDRITESQMERWVRDFDSWDLCDQVCGNIFDRTPWAIEKALTWSAREEEFVRRAGFVLMATMAVHDKKAPDSVFHAFLVRIVEEAGDERNFVKKAVNWALRQIGKRNVRLEGEAILSAEELVKKESKAARWVGRDALRELQGGKNKIRP